MIYLSIYHLLHRVALGMKELDSLSLLLTSHGKTQLPAVLGSEWARRTHSALFAPVVELVSGLLRQKQHYEMESELWRLARS